MIIVTVHLKSARTGDVTELARMHICNDETGTDRRRNYLTRTLRGRSKAKLDRGEIQRHGTVKNWPAQSIHIWNLVATALTGMGYGTPTAISENR